MLRHCRESNARTLTNDLSWTWGPLGPVNQYFQWNPRTIETFSIFLYFPPSSLSPYHDSLQVESCFYVYLLCKDLDSFSNRCLISLDWVLCCTEFFLVIRYNIFGSYVSIWSIPLYPFLTTLLGHRHSKDVQSFILIYLIPLEFS